MHDSHNEAIALIQENAQLRALNLELERELESLFAMVQGEVPSLLEDHHQFDSISAALAHAAQHRKEGK